MLTPLLAEAPEIVTSYGPVGVSAILAGVISWMAKGYRDDMKEALKSNQHSQEKMQDKFAEMLREQNATYAAELVKLGESIRELSCHGVRTVLLIAMLLFGSLASAQAPAIRLPDVQTSAPQPMPPVSPDTPVKLTGDLLYVIDSDVPVIVLDSPRGRIVKTVETGPVKVRGRFVGGSNRVETKTFGGKHVTIVEASHTGAVELLIVPEGAKGEADIKRVSLDVEAGEGPRPPPKPVKPDPPKPETLTNPFGDDPTFRVLVVYDASKPLPADQLSAIFAKQTDEYLRSRNCVVRRYQPDETGDRDERPFAVAAKVKRDSVPWVYVGKGKTGESVACPGNIEDMLKLLKKYGGE